MAATPEEPRGAQRDTVRVTVPHRAPDDVSQRDTVRLPVPRGRPPRPPGPRRAPLPLAAAVTALWAAVLSAAPVVAVVALTQVAERVSLDGVARYGLAGWLLAHGVPLRTGLGTLGLAPLGVAAFAAWRVARAGIHTTRAVGGRGTRSARVALSAAFAVGIAYGIIGAAAAALARGPDLAISPTRAAITLACFGFVAALAGALVATGALGGMIRRLPGVVRDAVRAGLVAALLVLAAGAALAGLAIALAGGEASDTLASYRTGMAGQAGLTLLCLAYAPNLAVWGASYLLGPGFAVGTETVVRTGEVSVGALPALPVFAGLPSGPLPGTGGLLVGAPLVAGLIAGWLLARRRLRKDAAWWPLLGSALGAAPVAGALLGLAAWAAAGPLVDGRLSVVGPVAWQIAAAGAGVIALGVLAGATTTRALVGRGS